MVKLSVLYKLKQDKLNLNSYMFAKNIEEFRIVTL